MGEREQRDSKPHDAINVIYQSLELGTELSSTRVGLDVWRIGIPIEGQVAYLHELYVAHGRVSKHSLVIRLPIEARTL